MGASVQISRRLCAIADMVTEGNRLVDVGCDHGYLPVYLKLENRIPSAIATDVAEGPLSRAHEHIEQYGLGSYIETRRCDGLADIGHGEGDTLVIAGMGGPVYRSRQLPRFIVTAVGQHLCETVHVLLVGSAAASANF